MSAEGIGDLHDVKECGKYFIRNSAGGNDPLPRKTKYPLPAREGEKEVNFTPPHGPVSSFFVKTDKNPGQNVYTNIHLK